MTPIYFKNVAGKSPFEALLPLVWGMRRNAAHQGEAVWCGCRSLLSGGGWGWKVLPEPTGMWAQGQSKAGPPEELGGTVLRTE